MVINVTFTDILDNSDIYLILIITVIKLEVTLQTIDAGGVP